MDNQKKNIHVHKDAYVVQFSGEFKDLLENLRRHYNEKNIEDVIEKAVYTLDAYRSFQKKLDEQKKK
jgi:hypothetical protein